MEPVAAMPVVAQTEVPAPVVPTPMAQAPVVEMPVVAPVVADVPKAKVVSSEEIAKLAYSYWVERGYRDGNPQEDWARAERALLV
jgi:hypothetical protein